MKSAILFVLMLALFAAGLFVVGFSVGLTSWLEVTIITAGFGAWQLWKRYARSREQRRRGKLGAA